MKPITRPFSFPTRNRPDRPRDEGNKGAAGYALFIVMIAVTVLAIGLLTVLPSTYQESRREKEEELIFRGNQYARAIYLFQQRFHRYPASVKELVHTNNLSFLRKPWPDPMTPGGKWRFIHSSASGVVTDSWTLSSQPGPSPLGQNASSPSGQNAPGDSSTQSAFGSSSASPGMSSPGGFGGSQPGGGFGFGDSSTQSAFGSSSASPGMPSPGGFGGSQPGGGFGFSNSSSPSSGSSGQPGQPAAPGSGRPTDASGKPKPSPDCIGGGQTGPTSAFFSSNQVLGAAIAGVASCNDAASLRVYNKFTHYSEWEFLGVGFNPALGAGIAPPPTTAPTTTPSGPGGQGQTGPTGSTSGQPPTPSGGLGPGQTIAQPAQPEPPEMPIPDPEPPPDPNAPPPQQ